MSKRISLEAKLIFAATVVLLTFFTAAVGVSVFGEKEKENQSSFIVSYEQVYNEN